MSGSLHDPPRRLPGIRSCRKRSDQSGRVAEANATIIPRLACPALPGSEQRVICDRRRPTGGPVSERGDLYQRLRTGPMSDRWHWLQWNFSQVPETPFARVTMDALLRCDAQMPGYADAMLSRRS